MMMCEPVQWKALPREVKDRYEERARAIALDSLNKKINETSDTAAHGNDPRSMSPHSGMPTTPHTTFIIFLSCYLLIVAHGRF